MNDPYFPRPRKGALLYEAFKRGYYRMALTSKMTMADRFFADIEQEQPRKDQAVPRKRLESQFWVCRKALEHLSSELSTVTSAKVVHVRLLTASTLCSPQVCKVCWLH